MTKPLILDLFCGEGGASMGYHQAGFQVFGVDILPQSRYPFAFGQYDALGILQDYLDGLIGGKRVDAIHASPPCQAYTNAQKINGNDHPDLIAPVRELLEQTGLPYVIENVPGSPLHDPVTLCGTMFGIETYRHREFETNWELGTPRHREHEAKSTKMGRPPVDGEYMHIVGNFSGVDRAREIMGMPWASRDGLREAIPPVYTKFIGQHLMLQVRKEVPA